MDRLISKLIIYSNIDAESILMKLADICKSVRSIDNMTGETIKQELTTKVYIQIRRLLELATDYGFDDNLWHNYIVFLLITNENPFSITCENQGAKEGSVNHFAKHDFDVFMQLFDYDFSHLEKTLGIDCFSHISNYKAITKPELMYNKNVSEKVRSLSKEIEVRKDNRDDIFNIITSFYRDYGVGMFGLNKAFRIGNNVQNSIEFKPINNMDAVMLDDLIGYEIQKQKLIDNTKAFVEGKKANNVLLFGDSGTGKSTSIKAIVNEFYGQGLRMIEIYKHQFKDLSNIIAKIKNRNYRFIIYMDDLSFEEFEIEYKFLKAVIEGGVETKPDNVLIYATSNRRHIVRESWKDRSDGENNDGLHRSDTMQEKLSLVNRFGITINFSKPTPKEFQNIVLELAKKQGIHMPKDELLAKANRWELSNQGISGRTASQFINYISAKE
ncbi:MAG: ATP-binding protein [Lachnospiraceae bacterium]|nr:ATP-binding protein [Lachnospiraceae bacterium]